MWGGGESCSVQDQAKAVAAPRGSCGESAAARAGARGGSPSLVFALRYGGFLECSKTRPRLRGWGGWGLLTDPLDEGQGPEQPQN